MTKPSSQRELLGYLAAHPRLRYTHTGECCPGWCPCGPLLFVESGGGVLWFRARGRSLSLALGPFRCGRRWLEAGLVLDARGFVIAWGREAMRFDYWER